MSKPESIKIEPWADFPRQSYSIFGDDFVHDKLFVTKVAAKGSRSTINIKQTVTSKGGAYNMADELKVWFDLPSGCSFYAKCKSNNYVKLHFDHGIREIKNRKWNFYGTVNCNKALQNFAFKLGACHVSKACHSDNRVKVEARGSDYNYFWYHRTVINHNKFTYGILGVYDIGNRILQKNNLFLRYKHDDNTEFFARAEGDGFRKSAPNMADWRVWFDSVTFDVVRKMNDTTRVGLEASISTRGQPLKEVQAVIEKKIPERNLTVKARVNQKMDFAISSKIPMFGLEDIATVTKGVAIHNAVSKDRKISFGWQIDLNI